tara:strand:+ start:94 stop:273 length:180 start_codon:yes stop_codon:yes gene_type:complete
MTQKQFIEILKKIENSIFLKLDKEGNYRTVTEDSARGIVRGTIRNYINASRAYFGNENE